MKILNCQMRGAKSAYRTNRFLKHIERWGSMNPDSTARFLRTGSRSLLTEDSLSALAREEIGVQKVVPKLPLRIVFRCELSEIGQLFIPRAELSRRQCEQLAPMWSRLKRREFLFDDGKQPPHRGPVLFPREVNRYAGPLVTGAHP